MDDLLYNPVYNALLSGDATLSSGTDTVKYFDKEVSPFAGFHSLYGNGFEELYIQLPKGRKILYATPGLIKEPKGWKILDEIRGLQFLFTPKIVQYKQNFELIPLNETHVNEMVELATLTRPGPFGTRTIEFGHYYGIFENGKLVAMTGQRLHVNNYTEISAVCTHPDHLGKGYAAALMHQQLQLILSHDQIPFLHVRADNNRAIVLYERLGFKVNREMNFYFMKRG